MRRRTLVDLLERDIARSDGAGPDWPTAVEDAVLRQDMQWVEEQLKRVFDQIGPPPGWGLEALAAADVAQDEQHAARGGRQDAEQSDQDGDHHHGVAGGTARVPGLLRWLRHAEESDRPGA